MRLAGGTRALGTAFRATSSSVVYVDGKEFASVAEYADHAPEIADSGRQAVT